MSHVRVLVRFSGKTTRFLAVALGTLLIACLPAVCQDAGTALPNTYVQTNLVSDVPNLALHTDANLANPWGLSKGFLTPWWVSNQVTGTSTLYTGKGQILPLVVTIPPANGIGTGSPTGTVFVNGKFIFCTLDGTISDWVAGKSAIIRVNRNGNAVYTGLSAGPLNGQTVLYLANAIGGIEVFDLQYNPVTLAPGAFSDSQLPAGYTPYNIQHAGVKMWVTYAQGRNTGAGLGYVDGFSMDGTLQMRLQHGDWMNAPWGVVMAPANFGGLSHNLLIGMLGSGQIAAFNVVTGKFKDVLRDATAAPISNEGLWALSFGNGILAGPTTTLYFTAGIQAEAHGLFGSIVPAP